MSEFDKDDNIFNTTAENGNGGVNANEAQLADDAQNVQDSSQNSGYFDYTNTKNTYQGQPQTSESADYAANAQSAPPYNDPSMQSSGAQSVNEQSADSADNGYFDNTAQYTQNTQNNGYTQNFQTDSQYQYNTNPSNGQQNMNTQYNTYSQYSQPNNGQYGANTQNTQQYVPYQQNYGYNSQTYPPMPNRPVKNSRKGIRVFCIILAVAVIAAGVAGISYVAGKSNGNSDDDSGIDNSTGNTVVIQQGTVPEKEGVEPDENGKYSADDVAKIVSESVVNIMVYNDSANSASSASGSSIGSTTVIASGIIISKDGYVLSNDHIYSETPNAKFAITLNNGKSYSASFVAGDSRSDLCVLKMKDAENLTPAVFADSSELTAGEDVIAIGSPYNLSGTVTKGIVSAPSRRISFQSKSSENGTKSTYSMRVIQTDTAINSGNSGGALVNMYGQVVGVCSSKIVLSGYEGLCFAIPSNDAIKYSESLIANKKVKGRAKLGITYKEINSAAALINDCPSGIMIQSIDVDSELYSSGLKQGDIVTEINGTEITSSDKALDIIDDSKAGDEVTLKVYIASSKSYKTVKAKMLEDTSVSSYTTQSEQQTSVPFSFKFQNGQ